MLLVFELGSVICAVAPNSITLIVGRAVAGLGAAGLLSGSTVITSYCAALEKRAMLLAMILGLYGVGAVAGPLIGGVITNNKTLTWRFIFWINLRKPKPPITLLYHILISYSFWGRRVGSDLVRIKKPSPSSQSRTIPSSKTTTIGYSRRNSPHQCNNMSFVSPTMGRHCLSVV